jgi:hypothetical protein
MTKSYKKTKDSLPDMRQISDDEINAIYDAHAENNLEKARALTHDLIDQMVFKAKAPALKDAVENGNIDQVIQIATNIMHYGAGNQVFK